MLAFSMELQRTQSETTNIAIFDYHVQLVVLYQLQDLAACNIVVGIVGREKM